MPSSNTGILQTAHHLYCQAKTSEVNMEFVQKLKQKSFHLSLSKFSGGAVLQSMLLGREGEKTLSPC